ncbi:MAG TPA: hypothetical protein VKZ49_00195 [Polyangiaceae bacterium]|nr:hypothetical protein [Polyangiaceae bacterium]
MFLFRLLFVCCATLATLTSPTLAQRVDRAGAEALFRAGREAAEKADYETACRRFEESHRLDPAVGTLFNLADCEEHLGEIASAWQRFREVAQRLDPADERASIARQRAEALEPRLPRLTIRLAESAPARTVVLRDDVELGRGSFGVALPLDPGPHVVVVKAAGFADQRFEVALAEGANTEIIVAPGDPLPAAPSPAPTEPTTALPPPRLAPEPGPTLAIESGSSTRLFGYVVGGVGVAGVLTSFITGGLALSKKSTMEDNCNAQHQCNAEGLEAADAGSTLANVSTAAFAVGAVALTVGTILVLTSDESGREVALGAAANRNGGNLELRGAF